MAVFSNNKRKMTSDTISLLNAAGAIACFLVPSFQLIVNNGRGEKKVTPVGWIMLAISFFLMAVAIGNYHVTKTERSRNERVTDSIKRAQDSIYKIESKSDRDSIISAVQTALKPSGLQYNPSTGEVTQIYPIISVPSLVNQPNPIITESGDTLLYKITITNLKDAIAKNTKTSFSAISVNGGKLDIVSAKNNLSNESVIIDKKSNYQIEKPFYKRGGIPDTVYFYFKLSFTDERGNQQQPFRSLVFFTKDLINKNLILPKQVEYAKIKKSLIEKGDW